MFYKTYITLHDNWLLLFKQSLSNQQCYNTNYRKQ